MPSDQQLLAEFSQKLDAEKSRQINDIATGQQCIQELLALGQPTADVEAFYGPAMARCEARLADLERQTPESLLAHHRDAERREQVRQQEQERRKQAQLEEAARYKAEQEIIAKEAAAQAIGYAFHVFVESRGERYRDCTLESFMISSASQARVVEEMKQYAAEMRERVEAGQNIILHGPCGVGKDHLLVGLARVAILEHSATVKWTNGAGLYQLYRDQMNRRRGGGDESYIDSQFTEPNVLIVSDPTPTNGALTEWQMDTLLRLIDKRYSDCLPTWISVNVANRQEAAQKMGAQVVDRLIDGGISLQCNWESYRRLANRRDTA